MRALRRWLRNLLLNLLRDDIELIVTRELVDSDLDDVAVRAIADQQIGRALRLQAASQCGKD